MSGEFPLPAPDPRDIPPGFPADETQRPVRWATQPVGIAGAVGGLVQAVIALALIFEWVSWTVPQIGAVEAVYTAAVVLATAVVRSKVTPVADPRL